MVRSVLELTKSLFSNWELGIPNLVMERVSVHGLPAPNMLDQDLLGRDLFTGDQVMPVDDAKFSLHVSTHLNATATLQNRVMLSIGADWFEDPKST